MRRRGLLVAAGLALAPAGGPLAQPAARPALIGYLVGGDPEPVLGYFRDGMRKLRYREGEQFRIEVRSAEGRMERLGGLAKELVGLGVDVLVAAQTPAQLAAKQATSLIPIVMAGSADPLGMGLVASLSRPGGNITGIASTTAVLGGKTLELVREALPAARRVAVLVNESDPFAQRFMSVISEAGAKLQLSLTPISSRGADDIEGSIADMARQHIDAVIVQPSLPLRLVTQLAIRHRLPTFGSVSSFPLEGGLMSYAPDQLAVFELVAGYVDRILKGARPADLPVQQPTRYVTTINLKTAKAIGYTVPKSLLQRADQLVE